ncbi:hypothetical protein GCM10028826_33880 [Mucilaginibacter boryungensis]
MIHCKNYLAVEYNSKFYLAVIIAFTMVMNCTNAIAGIIKTNAKGTIEVGVARIDITPETPIRLAGFGVRSKLETEEVLMRLNAKALAFGSDAQGPSILITVDLVGISSHITNQVTEWLAKNAGIERSRVVICASHTHSGPEIGTLLNILQYRSPIAFSDSLLPVSHMNHIAHYVDQLPGKLEQVAIAALQNRKPALVSWGIGEAGFAKNRRMANGPVDHAMPLLRVTDIEGNIRAILVNYACHAVVLDYNSNKIHGDWVGEAQQLIEQKHPGAIALVAIGCGADANPSLEGIEKMAPLEQVNAIGSIIATEAERLLSTPLQPVTAYPVGRFKQIDLPFAHIPTVDELIEQTNNKTVKGYYARLALNTIARGGALPLSVAAYPVQTWTFGKQLVMIFLGGEAISDYSIRLKNELGEKIWINAYSNDVPCYVPSRRALHEPRYGYEDESSMYYYNKPSRFADDVEDRIITAVHELLPHYKPVKRSYK